MEYMISIARTRIADPNLKLASSIQTILRQINITYLAEFISLSDEFFLSFLNLQRETVFEILKQKNNLKNKFNVRYLHKFLKENVPHIPIELFSLGVSDEALTFLRKTIKFLDELVVINEDFFLKNKFISKPIAKEILRFIHKIKESCQNLSKDNLLVVKMDQLNLSSTYISDLKLSERSYNALKKSNITTLDSLIGVTKTKLLKIDAIGENSAKEIFFTFFFWLVENSFVEDLSIDDNYNLIKTDTIEFVNKTTITICSFLKVNNKALIESIIKNIIIKENYNVDLLSDRFIFQKIIENPNFKPIIKEFWNIFTNHEFVVNVINVETYIKSFDTNNSLLLRDFFQYLIESKYIKIIDNIYVINLLSIKCYIEKQIKSQLDNNNLKFLYNKLSGSTLQEIGYLNNLSRERIRQIISRAIKEIPFVFEDLFSSIFEFFKFDKQSFLLSFPFLDDFSYEYLSIKCNKGKNELNIKNVNTYEGIWKEFVVQNLNKRNIENIESNYAKLIYYVLKQNSERSFSKEELLDKILESFKELRDINKLKNKFNFLLSRFRTMRDVVFDKQNKIRFCSADPNVLTSLIDLSKYNNKVISSNLIFIEYNEIMRELDVRDGYELYYLLKNSLSDVNSNIKVNFRRVPTIVFGDNASEEKQAIELLNEIAPTTFYEFCEHYEERYGIRCTSIVGNKSIIDAIAPYYSQGQYVVNLPVFEERDKIIIKSYLEKKEIWFIDEIKAIFDIDLPNLPKELINKKSLQKIGYTLHKDYLLNNQYSSITEYFRQKIFNSNIIDIKSINSKLRFLPAFLSEIYKMRHSFEYIEFSPGVFYSLQEIYIKTKIDLNDIKRIQQISFSVSENYKFFNGHTILKKLKATDKVFDKLEDNEFLLTSIIRQNSKYHTLRLGGSVVLYNSDTNKDTNTIESLCQWIISTYNCVSIVDVKSAIDLCFNCNINIYRLTNVIKNSVELRSLIGDSINTYITKLERDIKNSMDNIFDEVYD